MGALQRPRGKGGPPNRGGDPESRRAVEEWLDMVDRDVRCDERAMEGLRSMEKEEVDEFAIAAIVRWLCVNDPLNNGGGGGGVEGAELASAVLVFLPGIAEIKAVEEALAHQSRSGGGPQLLVVPCHSQLPTKEQQRVFARPPRHMRKVVLSTNIAETSITIDDVAYVVNSGRVKERNFDTRTGVSSLKTQWASLASCSQRRGRAGRVRPGLCIHLMVRPRHASLPEFAVPEMQRVPLDELCLSIKSLKLGACATVLAKVPQPPKPEAVRAALVALHSIGALDDNETLTPLGKVLAKLPVDPRLGKLIVVGRAMGCAAACITIAACMSGRDPFARPYDKRDEADRERRAFAGKWGSDHWAYVAAYLGWDDAKGRGGHRAERDFCDTRFVNGNAMGQVAKLRSQFARTMDQCGLPCKPDDPSSPENRHAANVPLVKAVIAGCLVPSMVIVAPASAGGKLKLHVPYNCGLKPHPGSTCSQLDAGSCPASCRFGVYHEKIHTGNVWLNGVTLLTPLAMALFGVPAELVSSRQLTSGPGMMGNAGKAGISMCRWLNMMVESEQAAVCVVQCQHALRRAISSTVRRGKKRGLSAMDDDAAVAALADVVARMLTLEHDRPVKRDGLGGKFGPPEGSWRRPGAE